MANAEEKAKCLRPVVFLHVIQFVLPKHSEHTHMSLSLCQHCKVWNNSVSLLRTPEKLTLKLSVRSVPEIHSDKEKFGTYLKMLLFQNISFYKTMCVLTIQRGPGSVDGIATAYGLDGPGIESRWRRDFPHLSRPALRPTQPPVQWVPGLSWG